MRSARTPRRREMTLYTSNSFTHKGACTRCRRQVRARGDALGW
jgi:hypothetical protein